MFARIHLKTRQLFGLYRPRRLPRRGPRPHIGAAVACGDLRLVVPAGLTDELWAWMLEEGWREVTFRPDRRTYRDVPTNIVHGLIDAPPEARRRVIDLARERAVVRPAAHRPGSLPSYIEIE